MKVKAEKYNEKMEKQRSIYKMLDFQEMQDCKGKTFWRAKGLKHGTIYTIRKNKSYRGNMHMVVAGFDILSTNCKFDKAVKLANEYENNLRERKIFKLAI